MALILHIDTTQSTALVGISKSGNLLLERVNIVQNEHSAFLHDAVHAMCNELQVSINDFDAFANVNGPGSYTGIRIGLSSVKGFCYATSKKMLVETSLKAHFFAASKRYTDASIFVPMIDARRQEVFMAAYNEAGEEKLHPQSLTLHSQSFENDFLSEKVVFAGSGSHKWRQLCGYANQYVYSPVEYDNHTLAELFYKKFSEKIFADPAYTDGFYIKDFYTTQAKKC